MVNIIKYYKNQYRYNTSYCKKRNMYFIKFINKPKIKLAQDSIWDNSKTYVTINVLKIYIDYHPQNKYKFIVCHDAGLIYTDSKFPRSLQIIVSRVLKNLKLKLRQKIKDNL